MERHPDREVTLQTLCTYDQYLRTLFKGAQIQLIDVAIGFLLKVTFIFLTEMCEHNIEEYA